VLLVRELGMRVHERDGVGDRRPLRRYGDDELRVGDGHAQTLTWCRSAGTPEAAGSQR